MTLISSASPRNSENAPSLPLLDKVRILSSSKVDFYTQGPVVPTSPQPLWVGRHLLAAPPILVAQAPKVSPSQQRAYSFNVSHALRREDLDKALETAAFQMIVSASGKKVQQITPVEAAAIRWWAKQAYHKHQKMGWQLPPLDPHTGPKIGAYKGSPKASPSKGKHDDSDKVTDFFKEAVTKAIEEYNKHRKVKKFVRVPNLLQVVHLAVKPIVANQDAEMKANDPRFMAYQANKGKPHFEAILTTVEAEYLKPRTGVIVYDDQRVYKGRLFNGKPSGDGQMNLPNGDIHKGEFDYQIGKLHGKGIIRKSNGDQFQGAVRKGRPVDGILFYKKGDRFKGSLKGWTPVIGTYVYRNGTTVKGRRNARGESVGDVWIRYPNGDYFEGQARGATPRKGILIKADGNKFIGELKNGEPHKGKMWSTDGNVYSGPFVDGKLEGERCATHYANGNIAIGRHFSGKPDGLVNFYWKDGSYGQLSFENGANRGIGEINYANGDHYIGDTEHFSAHGPGIRTYRGGRKYFDGYFDRDKPNESRGSYGSHDKPQPTQTTPSQPRPATPSYQHVETVEERLDRAGDNIDRHREEIERQRRSKDFLFGFDSTLDGEPVFLMLDKKGAATIEMPTNAEREVMGR